MQSKSSALSNVFNLIDHIQSVQKKYQTARKLYGDQLSLEFSSFEFILTNETTLSRIIAWLLDPHGSHAQSSVFLKLFSDHINANWSNHDCDRAFVRLEQHLGDNGRMDIEIRSSTKRIGVENKPFAQDGNKQITRYLNHLKATSTNYKLLYLSSVGSDPGGDSISDDELKAAKEEGHLEVRSYQNLLVWLAECRKNSRSDRVTAFIRDFESYIRKTFTGDTDMSETKEIKEKILESSGSIEAALKIIGLEEELKRSLINELLEQLRELAVGDFPSSNVTTVGENLGRWGKVAIHFDTQSTYAFEIEWESKNFNNVAWGICRCDEMPLVKKEDIEFFQRKLGLAKSSDHWPWYCYAEPTDNLIGSKYWAADPQPWMDIKNGFLAKRLFEKAKEFKKLINDDRLL